MRSRGRAVRPLLGEVQELLWGVRKREKEEMSIDFRTKNQSILNAWPGRARCVTNGDENADHDDGM